MCARRAFAFGFFLVASRCFRNGSFPFNYSRYYRAGCLFNQGQLLFLLKTRWRSDFVVHTMAASQSLWLKCALHGIRTGCQAWVLFNWALLLCNQGPTKRFDLSYFYSIDQSIKAAVWLLAWPISYVSIPLAWSFRSHNWVFHPASSSWLWKGM